MGLASGPVYSLVVAMLPYCCRPPWLPKHNQTQCQHPDCLRLCVRLHRRGFRASHCVVQQQALLIRGVASFRPRCRASDLKLDLCCMHFTRGRWQRQGIEWRRIEGDWLVVCSLVKHGQRRSCGYCWSKGLRQILFLCQLQRSQRTWWCCFNIWYISISLAPDPVRGTFTVVPLLAKYGKQGRISLSNHCLYKG